MKHDINTGEHASIKQLPRRIPLHQREIIDQQHGPACFTRLMNLALGGLTSTHCLAYLDDVIIWAPSFEEHLHRLRLLFHRIPTAALNLKPT